MEPTKAEWESNRVMSVAEVVRGPVDDVDIAYGREKIDHALRVASGPVARTELRIVRHEDPARVQAAFVEMHGIVNGMPVRARASAPTVHEAVDFCAERFRHRIERAHSRIVARHERRDRPGGWHHGDGAVSPGHPARVFLRDPDDRRLVRRKTFALETETVDEAVEDLELLDHDFFLFVNVGTGEENLVARDHGGYRLWQPRPDDLAGVAAPVTVDAAVAPECSVDEARTLLGLKGDAAFPAFVFFVDSGTGRGAVVYRRLDGHDGVISSG